MQMDPRCTGNAMVLMAGKLEQKVQTVELKKSLAEYSTAKPHRRKKYRRGESARMPFGPIVFWGPPKCASGSALTKDFV